MGVVRVVGFSVFLCFAFTRGHECYRISNARRLAVDLFRAPRLAAKSKSFPLSHLHASVSKLET